MARDLPFSSHYLSKIICRGGKKQIQGWDVSIVARGVKRECRELAIIANKKKIIMEDVRRKGKKNKRLTERKQIRIKR